jgi:hypothetical protein
MVRTIIESIDSTGSPVVPEPELKRRVDRAAGLLEKELGSIEKFPIESRWRIVHQPGSGSRVELDLTSDGAGIRKWLFDVKEWDSDSQVVRALRPPIWAFASALSLAVRNDIAHLGRELKALTPMAGE